MNDRIKRAADAENEVHDLDAFEDFGRCVLTPIARFPAQIAQGLVDVLAKVVQDGHSVVRNCMDDSDGITRAQRFEEGEVLMLSPPNDQFTADRYLMDFYDTRDRDLCSRMHLHTGMRYVRMMTGIETHIRVSTLSEPIVGRVSSGHVIELKQLEDELMVESGIPHRRFNTIIPPCTWVDMQIPRGTAHQFNALGPNAVIDTVHPEESIELFRESVSRINMMAQTVFLEDEQAASSSCDLLKEDKKYSE